MLRFEGRREKKRHCLASGTGLVTCLPGALSTPRSEGPLWAREPRVPSGMWRNPQRRAMAPSPLLGKSWKLISQHIHSANASQHGSVCPWWLCQRQKCPVLPHQRGLISQHLKKQQPSFLKRVRWAEGSTPHLFTTTASTVVWQRWEQGQGSKTLPKWDVSPGPSTGLPIPRASAQAAEEPGAREASKDPKARKQNGGTESPGAVAKVVSVS